jgi:hypothetical protein
VGIAGAIGVQQMTVLLNGGRELDVAPVPGADEFVAGLLGGAPAKPVVPTLKVVKIAGRPVIAVLIGSRHVGFLPQTVDEDVLLTVAACDLNGVRARARGHLVASSENGDKVAVKISLAEADWLLRGSQKGESAPVMEAPRPQTFVSAQLPQAAQTEWPAQMAPAVQLAGPPRPGWFGEWERPVQAGQPVLPVVPEQPGQRTEAGPCDQQEESARPVAAATKAAAVTGVQTAAAANAAQTAAPATGPSPETLEWDGPNTWPYPQASVLCPNCGSSWPKGAPQCNCGCWLGDGEAVSGDGEILGRSPIVLSGCCVVCGKTSVNGRRIDKILDYFPFWAWVVGALFAGAGLLFCLIPYFALRKKVAVSYSLCPHCSASRRKRKWLAAGAWLLLAALVAATVLTQGAMAYAIAALVLLLVAIVVSALAGLPLVAIDRDGALFALKGAGKEFLATMARTD